MKKFAKALISDELSHATYGLVGQPVHDIHKPVEFAPGDRVMTEDGRHATVERGFDDMGYPAYWLRFDDNPSKRVSWQGWAWGKPTLRLVEKSGQAIPETPILQSPAGIRLGIGDSAPKAEEKPKELEEDEDPIEAILARARRKPKERSET